MKQNSKKEKSGIRMPLQRTTLLMLIFLLFFFCGMLIIVTSIIRERTENDFQIRTSEAAVNNVASTIRANIVNYNYLSRLIIVNDSVVSYLKAEEIDNDIIYEARSGANRTLNLYSYVDSVCVFRNDGRYVNTGRGEYDICMTEEEISRILDARGSTIISINGNGTIIKKKSKPLLTMARAIYDINSQKLLGILLLNITSDAFEDTLALQDSEGMCISDINGTLFCGKEEIAKLFDSDYCSESMVYKTVQMEGENRTLTGTLANYPLVVLCVSGTGAETLPGDIIYALVIMLITFVLSTIVCAWFITTYVARPIKKLSEAMQRTQSSGWLKKIDEKMPDNEFGRLADNYNSMIKYLNELFNRLLENEKKAQKTELRVLQEQIKPHFLYNSLETISYMAIQENADRAHDALETLGNFYRNFLSKGDREIPLKRELRITQDYLSLQKLRYGDIFEDEYILDEAAMDYMVPKLILQPLVENCIYHGVRLKGEKGIIRITTCIKEDGLQIIVYDSGVGMSAEQIKGIMETKEESVEKLSGFGLRGTINRIRYYCDCENVVQIRSNQYEYTEIEINIPKPKEMETREDTICIE